MKWRASGSRARNARQFDSLSIRCHGPSARYVVGVLDWPIIVCGARAEVQSEPVPEHSGALSGVLVESDFRHFLSREVQRATRYQDFLSLCLIRARYSGAPRPDIQEALARRIAGMLRSADIVGTMGHDVGVLLVHTPDADATRITERVRDGIQAQLFEARGDAEPVRISLTLGLASFPSDATSPDVLLNHARTRLESAA